MLYFDRIDISKGIDINKTSASKECDIFHHWYFLNYSFKFQSNVCNRWHDLLIMSMNFTDIAILNIKCSDFCCIISWISKNDLINLMQNADLAEKVEYYKLKKCRKKLKVYTKIENIITTFGVLKSKNKNFTNTKYLFPQKI